MLLDNRRGVEAQTEKLFSVCRRRRLPIFTFVNKCDRVGEDPLGLLDDVEAKLGIRCFVATWPVRVDGRLVGVYDRLRDHVVLYERAADHGQTRPPSREVALDDPALAERLGEDGVRTLGEELELLEVAGAPMDFDAVSRGEATPVYFGSALDNHGVDVFLERFLASAPPPAPRASDRGPVDPAGQPFSGFVFKVQANMDPKHRDRIAFVRICSGRFEAGADAVVGRTGRSLRLRQPQEFLARERVESED